MRDINTGSTWVFGLLCRFCRHEVRSKHDTRGRDNCCYTLCTLFFLYGTWYSAATYQIWIGGRVLFDSNGTNTGSDYCTATLPQWNQKETNSEWEPHSDVRRVYISPTLLIRKKLTGSGSRILTCDECISARRYLWRAEQEMFQNGRKKQRQ